MLESSHAAPGGARRPGPARGARRDGRAARGQGPDTRTVLGLQAAAGNRAVTGLVQRAVKSVADPPSHRFAERLHRDDRKALQDALTQAATSADRRLRNSAQLITRGLAALYALTPTADSAARAKTAAKEGQRAYFGYPSHDPIDTAAVGGHVLDQTVADYNTDDMADNSKVVFDSPQSAGFRSPNGKKIFVAQPSRIGAMNELRKQFDSPIFPDGSFPPVEETLKHEGQHEVDVHFDAELAEASSRHPGSQEEALKQDAAIALLEYRTEYRAYTAQEAAWLSEPLHRKKDVEPAQELKLHFPDPVQQQIFLQIYTGNPRVKAAWDRDAELPSGERFRDRVLAMRGDIERISANPQNSPRVKEFLELLPRVNFFDMPASDDTGRLIALLGTFDESDRDVVRSSPFFKAIQLKPWLESAVHRLLADPRADVTDAVAGEAKARVEQKEQARRAKPPTGADLVRAFSSWAEVREGIERAAGAAMLQDPEVVDEYDTWSKTTGAFRENLDAFAGNLSHKLDWWKMIDQQQAKKGSK